MERDEEGRTAGRARLRSHGASMSLDEETYAVEPDPEATDVGRLLTTGFHRL